MPATMSRSVLSPKTLAKLRSRLSARIQRRFRTVTETHAVGPLRLSFTRVTDPDVVLDQIVEAEDRREKLTGQRRDGIDLHLPYWAELWDSAFAVGEYLVDPRNSFWRSGCTEGALSEARHGVHLRCDRSASSVLDLGCGQG